MGEFLEINYTYVSGLGHWRLKDTISRMVVSVELNQVSTIDGLGGGPQLFNNKINSDSPNTIYKKEMIKKSYEVITYNG